MSRNDNPSREDRVNGAIANYLEAVERGEIPDPATFQAQHADIAGELESFMANLAQFKLVTGISEETGSDAACFDPLEARGGAATSNEGSPNADEPTITFRQRSVASTGNVLRDFGDFELIQEIARGGMGVVYKARQVTLNRIVAVKMILAGNFAGPEEVERFHREAEAAAQLDHPGIVPVYEVGEQDGQHYFSMGFVDGQSLAKRVANGPLESAVAVSIVQTVAEAVQYAHDKGVIHRDLKPGNILLDTDGYPRVTDFGLAKLTESGSDLTGTGQILGTPSYMPPEQASPEANSVGRLSDVYSLGAILYCLLTGRPPFQAANPLETLMLVQRQDPVPPKQLNPGIPGDLDTIVLKCLDKSPARRYASARALAEELNRYREGRPIEARPVGRIERFWRWCRREPVIASLSCAVLLSLVLGIMVSSYFAWKESRQAAANKILALEKGKLAEEKGRLADDKTILAQNNRELFESERDAKQLERLAKEGTERQLRIANAERLAAHSLLGKSERPATSLALAIESGRIMRHDGEGALPNSHQALLEVLGEIGGRPLAGHQAPIQSVAMSASGRWVVTGGDEIARVWDLEADHPAANPRMLSGHQRPIGIVAISGNSRWVVTAASAQEANESSTRLWDLSTVAAGPIPRVLPGRPIRCAVFSPDSRVLVTAGIEGIVRVWDLTSEDPATNPRVLRGHQGLVGAAAISADSRWVVTGGWDKTARVWDLEDGDPDAKPRILTGHQTPIQIVALSPDHRWVASRSSYDISGAIRIWDMATNDSSATPRIMFPTQLSFRSDFSWQKDLAISSNNRWVVAGGQDGAVWLAEPGSENSAGNPRILRGHQLEISCLAFSVDSRWLVTGSYDRTARVWDLAAVDPADNPRILRGHQNAILSIAISQDNHWVVTGSADKLARAWDLTRAGTAANPLVLSQSAPTTDPVMSPDNRWLVTGSHHNAMYVWDLAAANPATIPRVLSGHQGAVASATISDDSRWLVTGGADKTLRIWDLAAADPSPSHRVYSGHAASVNKVRISADNRRVVTAGSDQSVLVWDLSVTNLSASPIALNGLAGAAAIFQLALSTDGRWVIATNAALDSRNVACLWDLAAANPADPRPLRGHTGLISDVAISPDSRRAFTGSFDNTVRVWELTSDDPAVNPRILTANRTISSLAISPDSRRVVTPAAVWDLSTSSDSSGQVLTGMINVRTSDAISGDSRWVVGAVDKTVRVWDLASANPGLNPRILSGHEKIVTSAAISNDGRWIVTRSGNGTVRLWRWKWNDLVAIAEAVGSNLTKEESEQYFPGEPYHTTFPDISSSLTQRITE